MMNRILFTMIMLTTFVTVGFGQETTATLEETISWIEGKLNFLENDKLFPTENKVKIDKTSKTIKYTRQYLNADLSVKQYYVQYIPIKLINPANILIKESEGVTWVYVYANDNKQVFKTESWFANEDANKKTTMNYSNTYFRIPADEIAKNPNLPERLKKALIHLIKLSGGTGEKF